MGWTNNMRKINTCLILLVFLLLGCSSSPEKPEPPPTVMDAKIAVSAKANPDVNERPSPVVVRIFELKSLGKYTELDFYDLFENYDSKLGADLLNSEQFHLNPGDMHTFTRDVSPDTQFVAVIAAYRNLNRAIWRDAIAIPTEKTTKLFVFVDKLDISIWKK